MHHLLLGDALECRLLDLTPLASGRLCLTVESKLGLWLMALLSTPNQGVDDAALLATCHLLAVNPKRQMWEVSGIVKYILLYLDYISRSCQCQGQDSEPEPY